MNETEAVAAVFGTAEAVKKAVGREKTIGLFLGCAIGEVLLSGADREEFLKLANGVWDEFVAQQNQAKGG